MTDPHHTKHSDIRLTGIWSYMPKKLHPYITVMRLDRPIGWWLLLLPGWWSILITSGQIAPALWLMVLFLVGAITMRAAGCVVNDLWDRDIDRKIERTSGRPLASGQLRPLQAFTLLACLSLIGCLVLLQLPVKAWLMGIASLPLVISYPLFKRITYWPQIMLGLTFSWGIFLGSVAASNQWPDLGLIILYSGTVFWVIGYDTIYAIQDMKDDRLTGIKSSALALEGRISSGVLRLYLCAILLITSGLYLTIGNLSVWLSGCLAMGAHLIWQTRQIDETDPKSALRLFKSNREAGLLLMAGILLDGLL